MEVYQMRVLPRPESLLALLSYISLFFVLQQEQFTRGLHLQACLLGEDGAAGATHLPLSSTVVKPTIR